MTFTIENGTNRIQAHAGAKDAAAVTNAERFASEAKLGDLAANWPGARLITIWNSLPGATPVKKFKDRATGVARIWKAIQQDDGVSETIAESETRVAQNGVPFEPEATQKPEPTVMPQGAHGPDVPAPAAVSTQTATRKQRTPIVARNANGSREGSKTAMVVELMKRQGGVTAKELMAVTGWQAHSVRGFISGTLGKKLGLTIASTKSENGERTYTIAG